MGLRIVGIILLANATNNKIGAGADHLVYGWGFNVGILLVLFLIGSRFRDRFDDNQVVAREQLEPNAFPKTVVVGVAAALLISLGPAAAWWQTSEALSFDTSALMRPMNLRDWHVGSTTGLWRPSYAGIDANLMTSLLPDQAGGAPVDLYVGYVARARMGHTLSVHIEKLWSGRWTLVSSGAATARLKGHEIHMNEWLITSASEKRLIWTSYWVDGRFTTSLLAPQIDAGAGRASRQ